MTQSHFEEPRRLDSNTSQSVTLDEKLSVPPPSRPNLLLQSQHKETVSSYIADFLKSSVHWRQVDPSQITKKEGRMSPIFPL